MNDEDKTRELDPRKILEEMREEYWRSLSEPEEEKPEEQVQVLAVECRGEKMVLDAEPLRQVVKAGHITRMPRMPEYVKGIVNLRGRIVPVVDLGGLLNLPGDSRFDEKSRLVVAESRELRVAFLVERVLGMEWLDKNRLQQAPESGAVRVKQEYVKAHVAPEKEGEEWMTYLAVEKILAGEEVNF